jgi:tRNA(Ile)-lysidine synthase
VPVAKLDLQARLRGFFEPSPPSKLGVAVSGGGDSVALLHLLADWSRDGGPELHAVTVDHGLRAEAAAEAEGVAAMCRALGVPHATLRWQGWDGTGNLMDAARRARIRLTALWAREREIEAVALGHTMDDQAETFLMRLARGSGVDGLAGMGRFRTASGVRWERPLLDMRREELRQYLLRKGVAWVEDPTNEDTAYDRIKARQALAVLDPLGITPERIGTTTDMLSMARRVLETAAVRLMETAGREEAGSVVLGKEALALEPLETVLRTLADATCWVSSAAYRPRLDSVMQLNLWAKGKRTLSGCLIEVDATSVRIAREAKAVESVRTPTNQPWDKRWTLSGPHAPDLEIRALGAEGLRQAKDWRATGLPRDTLIVTPGIWRGETLVAAPCAGFGASWTATVSPSFVSFLLSH